MPALRVTAPRLLNRLPECSTLSSDRTVYRYKMMTSPYQPPDKKSKCFAMSGMPGPAAEMLAKTRSPAFFREDFFDESACDLISRGDRRVFARLAGLADWPSPVTHDGNFDGGVQFSKRCVVTAQMSVAEHLLIDLFQLKRAGIDECKACLTLPFPASSFAPATALHFQALLMTTRAYFNESTRVIDGPELRRIDVARAATG